MRLLFLCILLILPAFFAAGEIALLRVRPSRVQRLIEEKKSGAKSINRLQRRLRSALMVSQLGGSIALVTLGWIGRELSSKWWPSNQAINRVGDIALFLLIVLFATIISGVLPKAVVLNKPEVAALRLAPLLEAVMRALAPLLALLEAFTSLLLQLVGLNTKWDSLVPALSAGELETLIETGGVTGLRPDEQNILEGVFALRDTQVREVMVPRSGMVTLPIDVCFSKLMQEVHRTRHARFLVIGDSLDDVRGLIDLRQLAEPISKGTMRPDTPLNPFLQRAKMVLETRTLSELLPLFRNGNPLLVVVDEHGGTEGLVTAADLTEEIVGDEIEADHEEALLKPVEGQTNQWLVKGDLELLELNRQLNLELPESDDHHTLAGFLLENLQHIPVANETFAHNGIKFEICSMKGPRIDLVKLLMPKNDPEGNK